MRLMPFSLFVVQERSMVPEIKPGEYVLTVNWYDLRIKDIIVFKRNGQNYIKRVRKIVKDLIYVSGDNQKESAKMSPVRRSEIVGRVILNY